MFKTLINLSVLSILLVLSACSKEISEEKSDDDNYVITHFTDKTELFLEFPKLIKNKQIKFITHLTRLNDYKPIIKGKVTVILSGAGKPEEKFKVGKVSSPGIFRPLIKPQYTGKRHIRIVFNQGTYEVIHPLGTFQISDNEESAKKIIIESYTDESHITYLKEQQWKFDFGVSIVKKNPIQSTITATGTLRAPSYANVRVTATSTGRLKATKTTFPYIGMKVIKGQVLAEIIPTLGDSIDIASLELELQKKQSILKLATYNRQRLETLFKQKVIAKKKFISAQSKEEIAQAELQTIKRRIQQQKSGTTNSDDRRSGVILRARITGVISHVHKSAGSHLKQGEEVFHIVNTEKLWLQMKVPEHDVARLGNPIGAWFEIDGFKQKFNTLRLRGQLISIGSAIDSATRTLPVLMQFDNPGGFLKVGMFVDSHIITSIKKGVIAVPLSAVIDDNGKDIVYVQIDGEHFEAREVKIGLRDDQFAEVLIGLKEGEYVVSKGGYLVRLASTSSSKVGHGHAH